MRPAQMWRTRAPQLRIRSRGEPEPTARGETDTNEQTSDTRWGVKGWTAPTAASGSRSSSAAFVVSGSTTWCSRCATTRYRPCSCHPPRTAREVGAKYAACAELLEAELAGLSRSEVEALRPALPWHLAEDPHFVAALLETATFRHYYVLDPAVFTARDSDARLYRTHSELLDDTDDDGLLHVERYDAQPQTVLHAGSALIYHPFLRRNFEGHVNDTLTQTLLEVARSAAARLRLALNEQHFMPATAFSEYFESDFWFGPPLSPSALDDPYKVGVTVYGDPKSGLTHEYPRLFVDWSLDKEGNKVVQLEELSNHRSTDQSGLKLLRYLHAIRDIRRGVFVHCDGAVRAYTPQQYEARATKQFVTGSESAARYRKVFRLDGDIETDAWSHIAARWFRGNRLMGEYLQGIATDSAGATDA